MLILLAVLLASATRVHVLKIDFNRFVCRSTLATAVSLLIGGELHIIPGHPIIPYATAAPAIKPTPSRGFQTSSGLIYFDLDDTKYEGPTPRFGQLVAFNYAMYYRGSESSGRSGESPLQFIDSNFPSAGTV